MKKILFVSVLSFLPAFAGAWPLGEIFSDRPKYIYINQTRNLQGHDLALKMSLKIAEKKSGVENALILLKELPPNELIQETATKLFNEFKIGEDRGWKGLLYLYAEKENQFKIEVSYDLEGVIPDVVCARLEEAARTYMLSDIPQDFLSELIITMNLRAADPDYQAYEVDLSPPPWLPENFYSGGAGVTSETYTRTVEDIREAIQSLREKDFSAYQPDVSAQGTLERYLRSLEEGIGDPRLPLLTDGSQVFRMTVPRNRAQQKEVFSRYVKGYPYQVQQEDDLALVIFKPGAPNLPIVLRRHPKGLWFVDEVKAWTYFHRWEDNSLFFPKYADIPFMEFLKRARHPHAQQPVYGWRVPTPPMAPLDTPLYVTIRSLEEQARRQSVSAADQAKLGEAYIFETRWISPAIKAFERAASLDPRNPQYQWRLFDLYLNNSEMEKALPALERAANLSPTDAYAREWLTAYKKAYRIKPGEFGGKLPWE